MSTPYDWYLRGALRGREAVLDLGCGAMRGALYCDPTALYVGVDLAPAMIAPTQWPEGVRRRPGKTLFVSDDIRRVAGHDAMSHFEFDTILLLDVIEHLPKSEGLQLILSLRSRWPKARLVIYTPDGWMEQDYGPDHPMTHRSEWRVADFPAPWMTTDDPSNAHPAFFAELRP